MRRKMGYAEFCIVPKPGLAPGRMEICGIAVGVRAPIHGKQEELNRALIEAAASGDAVRAEKLLKKGADALWKEADGTTALQKASNLQTTRLLVRMGADVNARDGLWAQPIHEAAFRGRHGIVKFLVESGADVNAKGPGGSTPLSFAARMAHVKVKGANYLGLVHSLIAKGADVNAKNSTGYPPLHFAENKEVAEILRKAGAKPRQKEGLQ
jgi:ankyrin repeat protein